MAVDPYGPPEPAPALTVSAGLALPEVQAGQPAVLAGQKGMSRAVRWVHVLELSHVEGLLRGGELILSTGIGLPTSNEGLRRYVTDLARNAASGLLVQLGERWSALPTALVNAAERASLPLVALAVEVPFVAITESVHARIVSSSYAELRVSERLHALFARLGTSAVPVQYVLDQVAETAELPTVFESLHHRVLASAAPARSRFTALQDWERRSRRATDPVEGRWGPERWLVEPVAVSGAAFGRLILPVPPQQPATRLQQLALRRGAEALALGRLLQSDGADLEQTAHARLLEDLAAGRFTDEADAHLRTQAAGVPTARRNLCAVSLVTSSADPAGPALLLAAAQTRRIGVLASQTPSGVDALVAGPPSGDLDGTVVALAAEVQRRLGPAGFAVLGRSAQLVDVGQLGAALREARAAASAGLLGRRRSLTTPTRPASPRVQVVRLSDTGLDGLLAQLAADSRVQGFVEEQLGVLLDGDDDSTLLIAALRAFLEQAGNKSLAAQVLGISRPALYARLERAAGRLRADLDDVTTRLSLHVALSAWDALTVPSTARPAPRRAQSAAPAPSRRTRPAR